MQYVGFWMRVIAALLDTALISLLNLVLARLGLAMLGIELDEARLEAMTHSPQMGRIALSDPLFMQQLVSVTLVYSVTALVAVVLIDAILPATRLMATPGKALLGMAMTDMRGRRLSYGRAIGRHAAKAVSALILCLGFVMAAFTKRKQALHDVMAETVVVRRRSLQKDGMSGRARSDRSDCPNIGENG